jgi:hypothetical protein
MSLLKLEKYVLQEAETSKAYVSQKGIFKIGFINKVGVNARLISLIEGNMLSKTTGPFFCFMDFKRSTDMKPGDYILGTITSCVLDNSIDATYSENLFTVNFQTEGLYLKKCETVNCLSYLSKISKNSLECPYCERSYKISVNDCYSKEMYVS